MSTIAQLADVQNVLPATLWGVVVTNAVAQSHLDAAEAEALSKMRARYNLANPPQGPFDPRLVKSICEITALAIIDTRGFNPASGADRRIADRAAEARKWLDDVERQRAHPVVVEVSASPAYAAPMVVSRPLQGWSPPPVVGGQSGISSDPTNGGPQSGIG